MVTALSSVCSSMYFSNEPVKYLKDATKLHKLSLMQIISTQYIAKLVIPEFQKLCTPSLQQCL